MKVVAAEETSIAKEAGTDPKKNIQICGHEGRTVLWCKECHGKVCEYDTTKHKPSCLTGSALA